MSARSTSEDSNIIELPLFPLPNVVFFPETRLPLHIFEPRYRQMVRNALQSDRRIAMALLRNEAEEAETETGDVYPIGGMGDIAEVRELADGRFNILLRGRRRYRLLDTLRYAPYRVARVLLLDDVQPDLAESQRLASELISRVSRLKLRPEGRPDLHELSRMQFSELVNTICSSASVDEHSKQVLLEMNHLKSRADAMIAVLDRQLSQEEFVSQFEHLRPGDVRVN